MTGPPGNRPNHPRRPPAHRSVSLRHSRSPPTNGTFPISWGVNAVGHVPSSNQANASSSLESNPELQKESSGESSNAERWFERSNNAVQANSAGNSEEPPFFLKNTSSSETPPDAVNSGHLAYLLTHQSTLPHRNALMHMYTQGSSSEDFRSVIDDLTVENKKLKRRLRKYEKLYDEHLQQDKLFEIRVHGLPADKKRELEDTLRKFAMSLDASPPTALSSEYTESTPALLEKEPTASSHTSTRFADSAYVSNTASGNGSGQHSLAPFSHDHETKKATKHAKATSRNQDIQSYLHDIPATLLPRRSVAMTEKAKRKLVVRRLEQIFAGKGAAVGGHQHPLQQQEVSQSAARADRMAIEEATGQQAKAEGFREARIMSKGEEKSTTIQPEGKTRNTSVQDFAGKSSPDQRPTRPLDLDLYRAQVPQDNIEYIRHLGFSPANFDAEEQIDDHGYIYLNVLTNMAQLHTLNVTIDFVKKSVAEYSDKLLLSRDGRKVRWKGGQSVTKTSSDGSQGDATPINDRAMKKNKKRSTIVPTPSTDSSESLAAASKTASNNKLAYVPLFFHRQDSADDDLTSEEPSASSGSPQQEQITGNSSGFASSGMPTNSSKRKRAENGPIIFYNKAKFCTDLSGDHGVAGTSSNSGVKYNTIAANPVGVASLQSHDHGSVHLDRGLLASLSLVTDDDMDADSTHHTDSEHDEPIRFSPKTASVSALSRTGPIQQEFEVSGLGGVQPSDHFKIEVQSRRKSTVGQSRPNATHFARNKTYPQRIMQILGDRKCSEDCSSPVVEEEVVATNHKSLPASALPEPATLFTFSSYDDSDDDMADASDAESAISDYGDDLDRPPPFTAPQMLHLSSQSSDDEDEESDEESSSDGSVDFLAAARQVDPRAVHEREREYDANMAERLAEEIPAGSSAATAGGGSGFNSPASPVVATDAKTSSAAQKRQQPAVTLPSVKRAKTSTTT